MSQFPSFSFLFFFSLLFFLTFSKSNANGNPLDDSSSSHPCFCAVFFFVVILQLQPCLVVSFFISFCTQITLLTWNRPKLFLASYVLITPFLLTLLFSCEFFQLSLSPAFPFWLHATVPHSLYFSSLHFFFFVNFTFLHFASVLQVLLLLRSKILF